MDAISLVSAWNALVLQLCCAFTEPTTRTWQQILPGWVLNRGPATVTGIFCTLGDLAEKHWTVYQKFFYRTVWSLEALCLRLMVRVVGPLILESGLIDQSSGKPAADLAIDDTTVGRYGRHVADAGWYKDASATGPSPQEQTGAVPEERQPTAHTAADGHPPQEGMQDGGGFAARPKDQASGLGDPMFVVSRVQRQSRPHGNRPGPSRSRRRRLFLLHRRPGAGRRNRPTILRPMGSGGSDLGSQAIFGVRRYPRVVQQDGKPSSPTGDDTADVGESMVCSIRSQRAFPATGKAAVVSQQSPSVVPGYAFCVASCPPAASNFTQLEVFGTS